ncbi:MAG: FAD/NAD(P)-binding oxidoreductase, partial [Shimia sp.]
YMASEDVALLGERRVEAVFFRSGGRRHELACTTVLLHHGVVPHVQLSGAVGVRHIWSDTMQAHVPVCDSWGRTEVGSGWRGMEH